MALYCIGDIQGCDASLEKLLQEIGFSPSSDTLYVLGDLVNRGPASVQVLRRLRNLGSAARCLLGNHDLHLLAIAYGTRRAHPRDTLADLLAAPDRLALIDWLRHQNLALYDAGVLMVHAGVLPGWTVTDTLALATEVENMLLSSDISRFLAQMYGNEPSRWDVDLDGIDRLRVIVNALTRLRFCTPDGTMEFASKEGAGHHPAGYMPWFDVPGRRTQDVTVAFGHWSTLGWLARSDVYSLDSGCVWGGWLSALRLDPRGDHELIRVRCPQAQRPGAE